MSDSYQTQGGLVSLSIGMTYTESGGLQDVVNNSVSGTGLHLSGSKRQGDEEQTVATRSCAAQ